VSLAKNGTVQVARLAVTGATRRPTRLTAAERALAGAKVPVDTSALPVGDADAFVDDVVASAAYRAHLTRVLIGRAVARVVADRCVTSSTV
jgi:aerobic carbon-monoxide dehydrogenase medium subunit